MEQTKRVLIEDVRTVINAQIRPSLLANAGDISILSLDEGVLRLRLEGKCSGCPSAWLTADKGVKEPLLQQFPDLKDVIVQTIPRK